MVTVRELLAKFEGNMQGFKSTVGGMKKEMEGLDKKAKDATKSMSQKFTDFGEGLKKKGKTMFKGVTVPLLALGGAAFTAAYDMDKAYNNIIVGTGATGDALEGLKDVMKNAMKDVSNNADDVSNAISNINTITGATGDTLEDLTVNILDVSRMLGEDGVANSMAFSKALEQFQIPAEDGVSELENLFRMTQDYGIGLDTLTGYLTKFGPVMNNAGFSMGETAAFMSQLEANGIQVTRVMPGLNQGFRKWAEEGKDVRKEFGNVITKMQDAGSETEALNIASEAFGAQGAQRITTAVRNGTIPSLEELGEVLEGNSGLIDRENERTKTLGERMMEMKNRVQVAMEPIGKIMLDFAESIMPKVEQAIEKLSNWFGSISEKNQKWIVILGAMAAAIGPVLMVLGMFAGWIGNLIKLFAPLGKRIKDAGSILKWLKPLFAALGGPFGIIIGLITALATGFVVAYKKSEGFRNAIDNLKDKIKPVIDKIKLFVDNIKEIGKYFMAIVEDGDYLNDWLANMPKSIQGPIKRAGEIFAKFRDKAIKVFEKIKKVAIPFIDQVKDGFKVAGELIQEAFGAAMDFVQKKIGEVKSFWDKNGSQILKAFKNVFSAIWGVVEPVLKWIVDAFKWAFPYAQKIFSAAFKVVLAVAKMIWGNIKGVIDGALDFIMGLIKTFSSLFTGDWYGMWEGIKQMLSGAVKFIWNFIQISFFGKILKGGLVFIKSFAGFFSTMWTGIKNTFSNVIKWIVEFVKNRFTSISNTISNITTGIQNLISKIWNFIWGKIIKPIITGIYNFVRDRFTSMRDTTSSIFGKIRDIAKSAFNKVKDFIINPIRDGVKWAIDKFNSFKDNIKEIFTTVRDNVAGWIGEMVQKVKDMPGKMADGLSKMGFHIRKAFANIGNTMLSLLEKGVNGVIKGINWVLDRLGLGNWKIDTWKVSYIASGGGSAAVGAAAAYAHGTDRHPGGPALVGDGVGRNSGSELIETTDGKQYLSPSTPTLLDLPKGAKVLSAFMTKKLFDMPAYANGIGFNDIISSSRNMMRGINLFSKDAAFDVYSYLDDPKKLLNKALTHLGVKAESMFGAFKEVPVAGFKKVKDGGVEFLKKKIDDMFSSGTGVGLGAGITNVGGWALPIRRAAAQMNEKVTNAEVNGILAQIQRESGGNQRIVQSSAVWDVNTAAGNPARGLLQYIPQTFAAYKMPGHSNIYSGYDQLLAFFNNRTWRRDLPYGRRGWGPRGGRKYKQGTNYVPEDGPAYLHKGEAVVPAKYNQPMDSKNLITLTGSGGIVSELSIIQELLKVQIREIINQNPFLQRMVDGVRKTREVLSNKLTEAKQGIQEGMNTKKDELSQQVNQSEKSMIQKVGQKAGEIISAVKAQQAPKNESGGIKGKVNSLIQSGGSVARKYFNAIEEDGDWLNDWATNIGNGSKKTMRPYLLAGYDYAKSLGHRLGSSAQKHLSRIQGYADGGIVDMKQLAWIAEGGWAESIISHDPAKRLSQRGIWEQTGRELGFMDKSDDKAGKEMISLLMRIADAVETGRDLNLVFQDRATARILEPMISDIQGRKVNDRNVYGR